VALDQRNEIVSGDRAVTITCRRRIGKTKLNPALAGPRILRTSLKMMRDYDPLLLFTEIGLFLEALGFIVAWSILTEYVLFGTFRLIGRAVVATSSWLGGYCQSSQELS